MVDWSENIYRVSVTGQETYLSSISPTAAANDLKGLAPYSCVVPTPTPTPTATPTSTPTTTPTATPTSTLTATTTPTVTTTSTTTATPTPTITVTATGSPTTTPTVTPTEDIVLPPGVGIGGILQPTTQVYTGGTSEDGSSLLCPVFTSFDISSNQAKKGDIVTVSWKATSAQKVLFNGDTYPTTASISIPVYEDSTFTFIAQNNECSIEKEESIAIVEFYPWEVLTTVGTATVISEIVLLQAAVFSGGLAGSTAGHASSSLTNVWALFAGFIRNKKKKTWGVVFDSVTRKPISRAIIRLFDAKKDTVVQTAVSDSMGLFSFRPGKGTYLAKVTHPLYVFPTEVPVETFERQYAHPYRGEVLTVAETSGTLEISIPLDSKKLSSQEKRKMAFQKSLEQLTDGISTSILSLGMLYSLFVLVQFPNPINFIVTVVYMVLAGAKGYVVLFKPKTEGVIVDKFTKKPVPGIEVGMYDAEFDTLLYRAFTTEDGKYSFVVGSGTYRLKIMDSAYYLIKNGSVVEYLELTYADTGKGHLVAEDLLVKKK